MAGELKHKDVGPELTYAEYHATDSHTIDGADAGTVIAGKATLAEVKADTDIATAITNSHASGSDNQVIPDELADLSDDATHRLVTDTEKSTWSGKTDLATVKADTDVASAISLKHTQGTDQGLDTGGLNAVTAAEVKGAVTNSHAPGSDNQVIPDQLSDLSDDATHRLVTDTEKSTWNGKTDLSTVKADTDIASAISLKHTQGTDQGLDTGGANAVTAAQAKAGYTHSGTSHAPSDSVSLSTVKADADVADAISKKHSAVTVSAPISLSGQALSLVNDAAAAITEIDTGALANSDTVIPTSKAVTTAIAGVGSGDVTSSSNLTDHCLVRGDGGAKGIQTTGIVVDDSGRMVNTSQPAFLAYINATQSNVTGDGTFWNATGAFWTEVYDQGGNLSDGTFTAPVTGKYNFSCGAYMQELSSSHVFAIFLYTSNATYYGCINMPTGLSSTIDYFCSFIGVDMDANDTAYMQIISSGSTKTVDVGSNGRGSMFSGHLVC